MCNKDNLKSCCDDANCPILAEVIEEDCRKFSEGAELAILGGCLLHKCDGVWELIPKSLYDAMIKFRVGDISSHRRKLMEQHLVKTLKSPMHADGDIAVNLLERDIVDTRTVAEDYKILCGKYRFEVVNSILAYSLLDDSGYVQWNMLNQDELDKLVAELIGDTNSKEHNQMLLRYIVTNRFEEELC